MKTSDLESFDSILYRVMIVKAELMSAYCFFFTRGPIDVNKASCTMPPCDHC